MRKLKTGPLPAWRLVEVAVESAGVKGAVYCVASMKVAGADLRQTVRGLPLQALRQPLGPACSREPMAAA